MRVAFDASCLVTQTKSGVAYYTEGLIQHLANQYPDDIELVGHYCNFLGRNKNIQLPQASNISYRPTKIMPAKVLNLLRRLHIWIPFELLIKGRSDFHLFPAYIGWPTLFKTPSAPVIYDLTFIDHPEFVNTRALHDLKTLVPKAIKRSKFVVTISESSSSSIQKFYHLKSDQIAITHVPPLAIKNVSDEEANKSIKQLGIMQSFILFLGNLEPRKNLPLLLEAYRSLSPQLRENYALVVAGGKGWHDNEIQSALASMQNDGHNIIVPGYVSDKQRAALFTHASAFVLPSHYEGFGMTLLEAMSYETPVLASDIEIFHEVCGKAALYFDPSSPSQLKSRLDDVLNDKKAAGHLVKAGKQNLNRFSWDEVTSTIYKRLTKSTQDKP
jgi:alpha-1,3-rhamnosyl/mannosyltransferase